MRLRALLARRANATLPRRKPGAKIFFLGFNRTATAAIDYFLSMQGVASAHWLADGENLALEIEKRVGDPAALKAYLDRWTAYSDLICASDEAVIEGNRHFGLFHRLYPDAWFVLNDRDPDVWLASRLRHRDGEFARRVARALGCTIDDLPARWKAEHQAHVAAVLDHFAGHPRFLHFRVDRDDIGTLIDFLAPDFRLDRRWWQPRNVTGAPPARPSLLARFRRGRRSFA